MFYFLKVDPDGPTPNNYEQGVLFERLLRCIVEGCGYTVDVKLRRKQASLEYDITAENPLKGSLIGEAKAHTSKSIPAEVITSFVGKMSSKWNKNPSMLGLFVSTSPLTSEAQNWLEEEFYPSSVNMATLKVITGEQIFEVLHQSLGYLTPKQVREQAELHSSYDASETYFVISESVFFYVQTLIAPGAPAPTHFMVIDVRGRRIDDVALTGAIRGVVHPVKELHTFGQPHHMSYPHGFPKISARTYGEGWFDYKFPANPNYFIGRTEELARFSGWLKEIRSRATRVRVFQIKSRSGVGKSSILIKINDELSKAGDVSFVVDARNLRSGLDILAACSEFLSLIAPGLVVRTTSDLYGTLKLAAEKLFQTNRVAALCIDQFESLFDRAECYNYILDLAQEFTSLGSNLVMCIGRKNDQFAVLDQTMQIDLHQLEGLSVSTELRDFTRDETNDLLEVLRTELMEVEQSLGYLLPKNTPYQLNEDLKQQILEFAGGFPWLLKRVCRHVIDLRRQGFVQVDIAQAGLKLEDLFRAELESLEQLDREFLIRLTQHLPKTWEELRDMLSEDDWARLETLQKHYLVRLSGRTFDTYNDVFKEYIRYNRVPVTVKFAFKHPPKSVITLLRRILEQGLTTIDAHVEKSRIKQGTIMNRCRELRVLGLVDYDRNTITARELTKRAFEEGRLDELIRDQVRSNGVVKEVLRRLFFRSPLGRADLVRILQEQLPMLDVTAETWRIYAQNLASWMKHTGLVQYQEEAVYSLDAKPTSGALEGNDLGLPATYISGVSRLVELFSEVEEIKKTEVASKLNVKTIDDFVHDAIFLRLITVERESLRLTPSGRLFLRADAKGKTAYVRDRLTEVPFVRTYLELLTELGTANHQDVFSEVFRRFSNEQWTWSTMDWRAKVLVNWLEYARMLSRRSGRISVFKQLSLIDFGIG